MPWAQVLNPLGNLGLSALIAAIPILFFLFALAGLRMKGYSAALITVILFIVVSVAFYGMPLKLAFLSTFYGALFGFAYFGAAEPLC